MSDRQNVWCSECFWHVWRHPDFRGFARLRFAITTALGCARASADERFPHV